MGHPDLADTNLAAPIQQAPPRHSQIYRSLSVQARGDLRHELTAHLRTGRAMRRPAGARLPDGRGVRPNILNISQRPAEAADRAVPGH